MMFACDSVNDNIKGPMEEVCAFIPPFSKLANEEMGVLDYEHLVLNPSALAVS